MDCFLSFLLPEVKKEFTDSDPNSSPPSTYPQPMLSGVDIFHGIHYIASKSGPSLFSAVQSPTTTTHLTFPSLFFCSDRSIGFWFWPGLSLTRRISDLQVALCCTVSRRTHLDPRFHVLDLSLFRPSSIFATLRFFVSFAFVLPSSLPCQLDASCPPHSTFSLELFLHDPAWLISPAFARFTARLAIAHQALHESSLLHSVFVCLRAACNDPRPCLANGSCHPDRRRCGASRKLFAWSWL